MVFVEGQINYYGEKLVKLYCYQIDQMCQNCEGIGITAVTDIALVICLPTIEWCSWKVGLTITVKSQLSCMVIKLIKLTKCVKIVRESRFPNIFAQIYEHMRCSLAEFLFPS